MRLLCFRMLFLGMLASAYGARSQQWNTTVPKRIVILQSTKDYKAALQTARQAAVRMGKKLDLEDNHPNAKLGLSMSPKDCEGNGYEYPCYTARGDGAAQDSDFISIEYSDAYEGFAKGYYIVVAAIGKPQSALVSSTLTRAKKWYPDAYAKQTRVWFGCMH